MILVLIKIEIIAAIKMNGSKLKTNQVMEFERADLSINSEEDPEWSDNENIHA